jgi:predicted GIY-YIG superfamily endonuclease
MYTVYILKCVDGKPYTGCTEDIEEILNYFENYKPTDIDDKFI